MATAKALDLPLVTRDSAIRDSDLVETIWQQAGRQSSVAVGRSGVTVHGPRNEAEPDQGHGTPQHDSRDSMPFPKPKVRHRPDPTDDPQDQPSAMNQRPREAPHEVQPGR